MSRQLVDLAKQENVPIYSVRIIMPDGDTIEYVRILSDGALSTKATWKFFEDDSAYAIRNGLLQRGLLNNAEPE